MKRLHLISCFILLGILSGCAKDSDYFDPSPPVKEVEKAFSDLITCWINSRNGFPAEDNKPSIHSLQIDKFVTPADRFRSKYSLANDILGGCGLFQLNCEKKNSTRVYIEGRASFSYEGQRHRISFPFAANLERVSDQLKPYGFRLTPEESSPIEMPRGVTCNSFISIKSSG